VSQKLEGCDDRAFVLDGDHLEELRWGAVQNRFPLSELVDGEVTRDDKGKLLGVFGSKEERCRVSFGTIAAMIWVPLERESDAQTFVAKANEARQQALG
jgi:hypothetical protein